MFAILKKVIRRCQFQRLESKKAYGIFVFVDFVLFCFVYFVCVCFVVCVCCLKEEYFMLKKVRLGKRKVKLNKEIKAEDNVNVYDK